MVNAALLDVNVLIALSGRPTNLTHAPTLVTQNAQQGWATCA